MCKDFLLKGEKLNSSSKPPHSSHFLLPLLGSSWAMSLFRIDGLSHLHPFRVSYCLQEDQTLTTPFSDSPVAWFHVWSDSPPSRDLALERREGRNCNSQSESNEMHSELTTQLSQPSVKQKCQVPCSKTRRKYFPLSSVVSYWPVMVFLKFAI